MRTSKASIVVAIAVGRARRHSRAFALLLLLALAPTVGAIAGQASTEKGLQKETQRLELIGRYRFAEPGPAATDIRWASRDSVYLLHPRKGVGEYRLATGLPVQRPVLPGGDKLGGVRPLAVLAVSGDRIAVAPTSRMILWTSNASDSSGVDVEVLKGTGGAITDIDLDGDRLALLGYPPHPKEVEQSWDTVIWTGSVADHLEPLRPLLRDPKLSGKSRYADDFHFFRWVQAGSIRFLPSGDLLAFVGHQPSLLRVSSTGKVQREWDLVALGVVGGPFRRPEDGIASSPEQLRSWSSKTPMIEDVLVFGKQTPGLLVRTVIEGRVERRLAVIEGGDVSWYSLPVSVEKAFVRLVGDVAENGDIVVLVADRTAAGKNEPSDDEEILVLRRP